MIADNRKRARKRRAVKCEPKPCWVQAFIIYLLHKNGGSMTLPLKSLKKFEAMKGDNKTIMDFDEVAETVTITAPEMILPNGPKIIHETGIVTPSKN